MRQHDHIGELLRIAGHRHMPDSDRMAKARAAAHSEWSHVVQPPLALFDRGFRQRGTRRNHHPWRSLVSDCNSIAPMAPPVQVGHAETVGTIFLTRAGATSEVSADSGFVVRDGDRLETSAGSRVALALSDGALAKSIHDSAVRFEASGAVTLSRGAVFVDAGPESRTANLHVRTPFGIVRHIGTQFEVRLQGEDLRVGVREGTIQVERAGERWVSQAGEALLFSAGRAPERRAIPTSGAEWSWLGQLAPPFTLEGSTVGAFLHWIERHHGLRWEFDDSALRERSERIVLHGSIDGLTAEEALKQCCRPAASRSAATVTS